MIRIEEETSDVQIKNLTSLIIQNGEIKERDIVIVDLNIIALLNSTKVVSCAFGDACGSNSYYRGLSNQSSIDCHSKYIPSISTFEYALLC